MHIFKPHDHVYLIKDGVGIIKQIPEYEGDTFVLGDRQFHKTGFEISSQNPAFLYPVTFESFDILRKHFTMVNPMETIAKRIHRIVKDFAESNIHHSIKDFKERIVVTYSNGLHCIDFIVDNEIKYNITSTTIRNGNINWETFSSTIEESNLENEIIRTLESIRK